MLLRSKSDAVQHPRQHPRGGPHLRSGGLVVHMLHQGNRCQAPQRQCLQGPCRVDLLYWAAGQDSDKALH